MFSFRGGFSAPDDFCTSKFKLVRDSELELDVDDLKVKESVINDMMYSSQLNTG
jgi:hypothetical protein